MKTFLLVRHCEAEGQEAKASLTEQGIQQAQQLMYYLNKLSYPIDKIISSPYKRAVQTMEPYAKDTGLSLHIDKRLEERRLSGQPLFNWIEVLKRTFDDIDFKVDGGESTKEATVRVLELFKEVMNEKQKTTLFVTHGNLMTLILRYFDPKFGFGEWSRLTNPDVYQIDLQKKNVSITRLWSEQKTN
ncbi:histidine phosphatase family protein [Priestia megaterium]|uniref:histidine phosphatase family protein n=1 Tax=Priestia megaterium TaxID=1404 RepID=UPI00209FC10B|nr:histidine phosphatase family protein [Priestia megaterium]MCP1447967.1 2,3-bisphosphoglycerate-dependent phosphoglycerate mutase [Priestia megaterium]MED4059176.1 phosphoglycerate mutase family protein [Priestia megaterium]WJD79598.1 histidine phosphatase family protein [Priestia megaterium]